MPAPRPVRLAAALACLPLLVARAATGEVPDYVFRPVPAVPLDAAELARPAPKFVYLFSQPTRWPGTLAWSYNPDNAPAAFANTATALAAIQASFGRWSAVCNVSARYDGITSVRPNTTVPSASFGPQPDYVNVVGWQELDGSAAGVTYAWYATGPQGSTLVDSDVILSPRWLTTAAALARTATHEWGHALGLAHSNVADAIMSGPPDTAYNAMLTLGPDDVHGCRCLYGPPAGLAAGYACSLPRKLDFGTIAVGGPSVLPVTMRNDGNAPLTINGATAGTLDFAPDAGCDPGTVLAPGASCVLNVKATPAAVGSSSDTLSIDTSAGEYRVPLVADVAEAAAPNFTGLWWAAPAGSENGWGLNVAHQGSTMFLTWFTYDAGGKSWWLSMIASPGADGVWRGDLLATRGPAFSAVPFNAGGAPLPATKVGSGSLDVGNPIAPVFTATVNGTTRTRTLARQLLNADPVPVCSYGKLADLSLASNYTDLWWAAGGSEIGWGVNLTHQGDTVFATWFTYALDGSPLWLAAATSRTGPGTYAGTLYRTSGPPFPGDPWNDARFVPTAAGTLKLAFANGNSATFEFTLDGVHLTKTISRQVLVAPGTACR